MARLIVCHRVRDYAAWRPHFDDHEPSRRAAGITNARVYRAADDPNDLIVLAEAADIDKARSWAAGSDLKTVMERAGVLGTPEVHLIG